MRLTGIEAVRYGALENACLSGLGEGLTVVLGPNESGKSSFTSLTRHVLYGYPDARTKERGYAPPTGARAGRLVFAEGDSEWAIERIDGVRRGPVAVHTRHGADRPGLLGEVVGGVSEQTYKVVLGFGLDELAQIESGDDDAVVSRLYAASAGLGVNPMDARKAIADRAAELYAARASKPRINALASRIRGLKDQIRTAENEAASQVAQQQSLQELTERLERIRADRDEVAVLAKELARDAQRIEAEQHQVETLAAEAAELQRSASELERSLSLIDVDTRVLRAAPALTAVLEETSGFRARIESMQAAEAQVAAVAHTLASGRAVPETLVDVPGDRAAVERWKDRLSDTERRVEDRRRDASQAEVTLTEATRVFEESHPAAPAQGKRFPWGVVVAGAGLVAAAAGVVLSQWLAAVLGAVLVVAGAVLLLRKRPTVSPVSMDADLARLEADSAAKRELARVVETEQEEARAEWKTWLSERGADAWGDDPAVVRELLMTVQERAQKVAERNGYQAAADRDRAQADAWIERLVDVVSAFDSAGAQLPTLTGATELAARAKATLDRAMQAEAERRELSVQLATVNAALRSVSERLDQTKDGIVEIATARGLDDREPVDSLQAMAGEHDERLASIQEEFETVANQVTSLRTTLDEQGRNDQMAVVRQQIEGARADAGALMARYAKHALALRLLDGARERFENERQGPVVETASRVFSAMTEGRYRSLLAPLDGSGISVFTAQGARRTTDELSRGTAEQLYLALRVGLIGSLGEMGRALPILMDDVVVNFDPERRGGAVAAVSELAVNRQVVFFTCHPETAALLSAGVPGATLVELNRCGASG